VDFLNAEPRERVERQPSRHLAPSIHPDWRMLLEQLGLADVAGEKCRDIFQTLRGRKKAGHEAPLVD
jgi:hypothetical protein